MFIFMHRDNSMKGHCLGSHASREVIPYPERNLSRVSVVMQRLLIHLPMLLSALLGKEKVSFKKTLFPNYAMALWNYQYI